jgi:hypothetical protein
VPEHPADTSPPVGWRTEPFGFAVLVLRPTGDPNTPAADAYGPHGEMEAHDLATLAVRCGHPAFVIDLDELRIERYRGEEADRG